jgi:phage-related tail protein
MTNDRTYWRACDDKRLIEEARNSTDELAIALGERLEATADIADEAEELKHRLNLAIGTIRNLQAELAEMQRACDDLMEINV